MSNSSTFVVPNGSRVNVRTGVLRGAGPQGPIGPQGPKGDQGDLGPQGPPGSVNDVAAACMSSSAVATANDSWYTAAIGGNSPILSDVVTFQDDYSFKFKESTGAYLMLLTTQWEPTHGSGGTGTATGSRWARVVDAAHVQLGQMFTEVAASTLGQTRLVVMDVVRPDASKIYHVELQSNDDIAVSNTFRYLSIIRIGSGPQGMAGPTGSAGVQGPQGPQGVPGNASSGFTTFDGLIGGADSSVAPAFGAGSDWLRTTDQGLPVPRHNEKPSEPFFMNLLATALEPKLVRRYTNAANRTSLRGTAAVGDVSVLTSTGQLQFREQNGNENDVARVIVSGAAPPTGAGQAAPGVLWIKT